ncbi:MAG TPA: DEAD/DEAH box helicase [Aquabacterium sp.]|uniref:DEAD/DEAH box helicase n=1 Tax=Aquabacterium sp. TaxID=1872578 RepID=UPI002E34CF64|nr:DEAD/DEAH box helicase [Aquabacterium sp.]HEX5372221.1 DEAD/DEAH box helicase [Aquabacterium sp.]
MSFENLGLAEPILRAISEAGYHTPTPIQSQAIPAVLSGGDLLAGAQTGTGKTAGFTLPLLHMLMANRLARVAGERTHVRALILTPTRELAAQVEESVRTYGKHLPLRSIVVFGGVGMNPQIDALRRGVDILVATPGRLLDHHQQGTVDLSKVEFFVLDEADRMLDMGFIHDIKRVLAVLPPKKQSLLFSATFSDEIKALAERLLNQPKVIEVARRNATADTVEQVVHPVDRDRKKEMLAHLISSNNWHQVLVFTRMKHGANRLVEFLQKQDITAMAIHGNKSQSARTRALAEFKSGDLQVLVATDIAARGIDIDQLPHVVNFELPNVPEDYVHRIGRTGRAGSEGRAISLVCVDEEGFLADIERLIKRSIPRELVAGFEPDPHAKPEPIQLGRRVLHGGGGAKSGGGAHSSHRSGHGQGARQGQGRQGAGSGSGGRSHGSGQGRGPGGQVRERERTR